MSGTGPQDATLEAALAQPTITTFWAARLDFAAETIGVWTGPGSISATGSGDTLLDGMTFDALAHGIAVQVGDNSFSYSGSDQLDIALGVPAEVSQEISAANSDPTEWRARQATIWRALLIPQSDALAQPVWAWRRIRTGTMDSVQWSSDGQTVTFKLTVESHAALISSASGSTYLDQPRFDPADTSQKYAVALANGGNLPSTGTTGGGSGASARTIATAGLVRRA